MSNKPKAGDFEVTIQDLYPGYLPDKLREAEENFMAYLDLIIRLYERLRADPVAYVQFKALTTSRKRSTIR